MPKPLDPEKREAIEQAIRDGKKRNEIAREFDVSGATVTNIGKKLEATEGLRAFDRSATKHATEARVADQAAERARLRGLLLEDAHRLRAQLWEPCTLFNFGGKDNTLNSVDLAEPTFEQKAKIMTSVGIAVDKIVRLDQAGESTEQAATLLGALVGEIRARRTPEATS